MNEDQIKAMVIEKLDNLNPNLKNEEAAVDTAMDIAKSAYEMGVSDAKGEAS